MIANSNMSLRSLRIRNVQLTARNGDARSFGARALGVARTGRQSFHRRPGAISETPRTPKGVSHTPIRSCRSVSALAFVPTAVSAGSRILSPPRASRSGFPRAALPDRTWRRHVSQNAAGTRTGEHGKEEEKVMKEDELSRLAKLLNPPASTRPPKLDLPPPRESQQPATGLVEHLLATGRAYLSFYKAGLRAVFANRRLAASLPLNPKPALVRLPFSLDNGPSSSGGWHTLSKQLSRSDLVLLHRTRHDVSLLPAFALLLVVCGELTPLVVVAVPGLTPLTCRIPRQVESARRRVEERRAVARDEWDVKLRAARDAAATSGTSSTSITQDGASSVENGSMAPKAKHHLDAHCCRLLSLVSPVWAMAGLNPPRFLTRRRFAAWATWVLADDAAMARTTTSAAADHITAKSAARGRRPSLAPLVKDEVEAACVERGIDVLGKDEEVLRRRLEFWVGETTKAETDEQKMEVLRRLVSTR